MTNNKIINQLNKNNYVSLLHDIFDEDNIDNALAIFEKAINTLVGNHKKEISATLLRVNDEHKKAINGIENARDHYYELNKDLNKQLQQKDKQIKEIFDDLKKAIWKWGIEEGGDKLHYNEIINEVKQKYVK